MEIQITPEALQLGLSFKQVNEKGVYLFSFSKRASIYDYIVIFGKTIYANPFIRKAIAEAHLRSMTEDDGYDTIVINHSVSIFIDKDVKEGESIKAYLRFVMEDTDVSEYRFEFNPVTTIFTFQAKSTNGKFLPLNEPDLNFEIIKESYLQPYQVTVTK